MRSSPLVDAGGEPHERPGSGEHQEDRDGQLPGRERVLRRSGGHDHRRDGREEGAYHREGRLGLVDDRDRREVAGDERHQHGGRRALDVLLA